MKLISILKESITEQLGVGLWDLPEDPKAPIGLTKDNKPIYRKTSVLGGGGNSEPLPPLGNLNKNSINCLDDVLSVPKFKGKWSEIGGFNNRTIGTTSTKSEHAFGNALDWHGKDSSIMQELADYFVSNAERLKIKYIIYNYKIWSSATGWTTYNVPAGGSPHTDHVHVDFIK